MSDNWKQQVDPTTRNEQAAEKYADAVIASLAAEWQTVPVLRAAKCVGIARIRKILARSSADALLGLVLQRLVMEELVSIKGEIIHFTPTLITRFERSEVPGA